MRRTIPWLWTALLFAFFAVFLLWPIGQVVAAGFRRHGSGFTLDYVRMILADPTLMQGLANAAGIAATVTILCLLIAAPAAYLTVRCDFPGRALLSALLLAPLVLPPFVAAIGMRLLLGRLGPLTMLLHIGGPAGFDWLGKFRVAGIVAVEALHLYPVLLLNLQAALSNIDPAMEQAAANLGAGRWRRFFSITLPLLRPGLLAGATLTLIWSFTELGTPLMFDYSTITPVQVFRQITDVAYNPLPYALVVIVLAASAGLYGISKTLLGPIPMVGTAKGAGAFVPRRLKGRSAMAAILSLGSLITLAILPHISVILISLSGTGSWYRSILPQSFTLSHFSSALRDDRAMPAVLHSVIYALAATTLATGLGLAAALLIVRGRTPGRRLLDYLAMLPLAAPGIVLAFGYLAISVSLKQRFGDRLPIWLDVQANPVFFLILAYAVRRLPFVVRSAAAGLQQTPQDLQRAAANLGAKPRTVLARITIPLVGAHLIAGAILAFAFSLLEVSDSLILAQRPDYFPITRAIYELSQRLGDGIYLAAAMGVWAMALLAVALLAAHSLLGRRLGAMFQA